MAYSRLARRLRARGLDTFRDYLDLLEQEDDPLEWEAFTNALTTNLTAFFRESHHFPILADFVKGRAAPVSVWCSAASTGEEPYSIAITLKWRARYAVWTRHAREFMTGHGGSMQTTSCESPYTSKNTRTPSSSSTQSAVCG